MLGADRLANLPTALQSYILSNLAKVPRRPIKVNLDVANSLQTPLPSDLLAVAKSSNALAEATADALGDSVRVLNSSTAQPFDEWVTALGPFVKGVSFYNAKRAREKNLVGLSSKGPEYFDEIACEATKVFDALKKESVSLELLDVKSIPFSRCKAEKELETGLLGSLKQSGESLKELGLRATGACARAVSEAYLPALQVVELELKDFGDRGPLHSGKGESAESFMEMLRALDGHAGKAEKKATFSELRLLTLHEAPCTDRPESCAGLFDAVKTLKLRDAWSNLHNEDPIAKFISLFPNLECLHWKGAPTEKHLRMIHGACGGLQALHLSLCARYTHTGQSEVVDFDSSTLDYLFLACQGKLTSLAVKAKLTCEQLRILGENSPELEHLRMEIGRDNIEGLSLLVGSHCRKLRKLELWFVPDEVECLGEDGWRILGDAVKSASDELYEISIMVEDERYPMETATTAMVEVMTEIVKFLGDRARKVCFQVPMATSRHAVVAGSLGKMMRTCGAHAKNLEDLTVSYILTDVDYDFEDEEEEKEIFEQLLEEKKIMMDALPLLETTYFGYVDDFAEERLEELMEG